MRIWNMPKLCLWLAGLASGVLVPLAARAAEKPRSRTFLFTYAATVEGLPPRENVRVWLPVPSSNSDQEVAIVSQDLPGSERIAQEPQYGNRILSFKAYADKDGRVSLRMVYRVTRHEVKGAEPNDQANVARLLQPDARVPIDGKPLELIRDKKIPPDRLEAARVLYDVVNGHMRYSKDGTGWGRGDAAWACASGYGNCTDFHSLFIALARSQKIPALFEIGFPLPEKSHQGDIAGYHCWAKFHIEGKGWIPVDISEANKHPEMRAYYFGSLTPDRVAFSTGRDLELVPRQDGSPLNYFVYPYVEVGGKPCAADKVKGKYSFEDIERDSSPQR